jgi:hypothetical protein
MTLVQLSPLRSAAMHVREDGIYDGRVAARLSAKPDREELTYTGR